jgi:hypothetical protein
MAPARAEAIPAPAAPVASPAERAAPLPVLAPPSPRPGSRRRPSVAWSVAAGLVTALVPMAIGGSLMPSGDDALMHAGLYTIQAGFMLAPLVSHAVAGEWGRGALFMIPGVVAEAGMIGVLSAFPDVASQGEPISRVPFAIFLGLSIAGAGAGIIDSFLGGERWDRLHLTLTPTGGPHQLGLALGGSF